MRFTDKVRVIRMRLADFRFFKYIVLFLFFHWQQIVNILDPSELHRPEAVSFAEKDLNKFRDFTVYENDPIAERVLQTYKQMHKNQTVDFVRGKFSNGLSFSNRKLVNGKNVSIVLKWIVIAISWLLSFEFESRRCDSRAHFGQIVCSTLVRIQIKVIVCFSHRFLGNCFVWLFFFLFHILLVIAFNDRIMCVLRSGWPAAQMAKNASDPVWTEIKTNCFELFFITVRFFYHEINQKWDPFEHHSGRHADWLQFNHFKSTWVINERINLRKKKKLFTNKFQCERSAWETERLGWRIRSGYRFAEYCPRVPKYLYILRQPH